MAKLCLPLGFVLAVMISAVLIIAFGASSMLQSKASEAATAKTKYAEDVRPPAKSSLVAKRRLTDPSSEQRPAATTAPSPAPTLWAATFITAIDLGTASNFAILTRTGVTTTGVTRVTGNIGVSPIAATAITGFGLVAHSSNEYSTSSLVVGGGKIYAADYLHSTPTTMTTAISDMETAYTAAAGDNGVVAAENLNRAAGHVNGLTLPGGLYKWTTSVTITESLTFDAANNSSTVWIMQIAGSLSLGASASVTLTNEAQPMNIFWQVAGTTNIMDGAHAEGIILCATAIIFGSGASLTGRALAQTEVTMIATTVTEARHQEQRRLAATTTPTPAPTLWAATVIPAIGLGTASDFAILTKTGVTSTGNTIVTGNIGVCPAAATYITGFGLVADSSNTFSTSHRVHGGMIYAPDYGTPTPAMMTTAISDMETAYTAAAGDNGTPTKTELAAGLLDGLTLPGGLYKWTTSVDITTSLTFNASNNNNTVWIMQIAGSLRLGASASVTLTNGAQPMNIFWQVAGTTNILADAHAEGIILCATAISFGARATLTGRALAQTRVTMIGNTVTEAAHQRRLWVAPRRA